MRLRDVISSACTRRRGATSRCPLHPKAGQPTTLSVTVADTTTLLGSGGLCEGLAGPVGPGSVDGAEDSPCDVGKPQFCSPNVQGYGTWATPPSKPASGNFTHALTFSVPGSYLVSIEVYADGCTYRRPNPYGEGRHIDFTIDVG
jgi:hypothetical protein